jgi:hypothetical protein
VKLLEMEATSVLEELESLAFDSIEFESAELGLLESSELGLLESSELGLLESELESLTIITESTYFTDPSFSSSFDNITILAPLDLSFINAITSSIVIGVSEFFFNTITTAKIELRIVRGYSRDTY